MNKEDIVLFDPDKIKLFLKSNIIYTCKIIKINEDSLIILDKFENKVLINISMIERMEELK